MISALLFWYLKPIKQESVRLSKLSKPNFSLEKTKLKKILIMLNVYVKENV